MSPGIRQSFKLAFYACPAWVNDQGVYTGDHDGWHMRISAVEKEPWGAGANTALNVSIVLPPRVVKHWAAHIRAKLAS